MPNPYAGYAAVTDDVRHTYERVFFGRQLTGDAMQADVAGMAAQPGASLAAPDAGGAGTPVPTVQAADLYGPEPSHDEREATATAYAHAANTPGIRREIEESGPDGRPYQSRDATALQARGNASREALYGPETAGKGGGVGEGAQSRSSDLYGPETGKQEAGNVWGPNQSPAVSGKIADLYGPRDQGAAAGNVWGPAEGQAPSSPQPAQGNDMTPG